MSLKDLEKDIYKRDGEDLRERLKKAEAKQLKTREKGWFKMAVNKWGETRESLRDVFEGEQEKKKSWSWQKWAVATATGFALIAFLVGGFYLFLVFNGEGGKLEVEVSKESVRVGEELAVKIKGINESGQVLRGARVSIALPAGLVFVGETTDRRVLVRQAGEIAIGEDFEREFKVMAVKDQQSLKKIQASFFYKLNEGGTEFEVREEAEVVITEPMIFVDIESPDRVFSGQEFKTVVTYRNLSDEKIDNFKIKLELPAVFSLESSEPEAEAGKFEWLISELEGGEEDEIIIDGILTGMVDSFFDLMANVAIVKEDKEYEIGEDATQIVIQASPLELALLLEGRGEGGAVAKGESLNYVINYKNNTDIDLKGLKVSARFKGEMFDLNSFKGMGVFNIKEGRASWDASSYSKLGLLPAGESGQIKFSIKTKEAYPASDLVEDKNFTLEVEAEIESPTVPPGVGGKVTKNGGKLIVPVRGESEILVLAYRNESGASINNGGRWPPRVGEKTELTIHWQIMNYATDLVGVQVETVLAPGVEFTKNIYSNTSSLPEYDPSSRRVTWNLGRVVANKGIVTAPAEAVFQVAVTPSREGEYVDLIRKTVMTAIDDFVDEEIRHEVDRITTKLTSDPTVKEEEGKAR